MGTAVHGDKHIFEHRLALPQPDILEGAGHPHLRNLVRSGGQHLGVLPSVLPFVELLHSALGVVLHNLLPLKPHRPVGGLVYAGDHIEGGGLARAVGADKGHNLPLVDLKVQIVHGHHTAKLHSGVFHL